jgi:CubicO group peptidase (beta-lactamase class C family)
MLPWLAVFSVLVSQPNLPAVGSHPRVREAAAALARWLDGQRAYQRIPGISAAVVHDQEVVWEGGSGLADLSRKTPATSATVYSICSISKLFTSLALLQLRDRGKLRLDDPVAKHLPWFTPKNTHADGGPITVKGLLTHASGLPSEAADSYWVEPKMEFPTHDELVKAVSARETLYRPETYIQYSNMGFTIAGEVVAAAAGQSYADYVIANLLQPIGLENTFSEMPVSERGKRLATGYSQWPREGDRHVMPFYQTKAMAPAAGYASTALDLAKFASWQFRVLGGQSAEVIGPNTLREMQRVHFVDPGWQTTWGLGFQVWRDDGKTFVGHGGSCPGYRTQLLLKPDERIATIAMANTFDTDAHGLAQQVYHLVAPAIKAALADSARTIAAASPELERYLGSYSAIGGELEVIRWEGGLATMRIPSDRPAATITKYRKVGEHTFRAIRADGNLGDAMTFDLGPDGRPARARTNYLMPRIR